MKAYYFDATNSNGASKTHSLLGNAASATKRLWLFGVQMFSGATADNGQQTIFKRSTANGTMTSITQAPRDPADGTAVALCGHNHSAEPTYTSNTDMLTLGGHQRGTFVWFAQPGAEIVIANTNSAGIGAFVSVMATGFSLTIGWEYSE